MIRTLFNVCIVIVMCVFPYAAHAQAGLVVSPSSGQHRVGESFSVLIAVNSGGVGINAANINLLFDKSKLQVTDIGYSNSIFELWAEKPQYSNSNGTITLSGGLPSPGYSGSFGALLRVTFKGKATGSARVSFGNSSVLANDGSGTNILDSMKGAEFTIVAAPTVTAPVVVPQATTTVPVVAEPSHVPPRITEWPQEIEQGSPIVLWGVGEPGARVQVTIQRENETPFVEDVYSKSNGEFLMVYREPTMKGFYRVWVKGYSSDGVVTEPSEVVSVLVSSAAYFRVGSRTFSFETGMYSISMLLTLALIGYIYLVQKNRKLEKEKEIVVGMLRKANRTVERVARKRQKQQVVDSQNNQEK